MKKITPVIVTIFIILIVGIESGSVELVRANRSNLATKISSEDEVTIEDISSKLIRFHVIANSDGELDQELKLKVRDEVLEYIQPILRESASLEESREILRDKDDEILAIADKVIADNGYSYKVESTLSKEYFPVKTYGNITLPQGEYEAYRIVIGSGEGQNWWCVMFPPICFVDITKGEIAYEETENEMKSVLNEKEFESVENTNKEGKKNTNKETEDNANKQTINNSEVVDKNTNIVDNSEDQNIVVKFKFVEMFKGLLK